MKSPFSRTLKMMSRFAVAGVSFSFLFNKDKSVLNFLIALLGLYFISDLTFYLPFLDECYLPMPLAEIKSENQNEKVELELNNLPPNTKIVFWAAEKKDVNFPNPLLAYIDTKNLGMSQSDENGNAKVLVHCPGSYFVRNRKLLPKHIHYRYELKEFPGMYSRVYTKYVNC